MCLHALLVMWYLELCENSVSAYIYVYMYNGVDSPDMEHCALLGKLSKAIHLPLCNNG